MKPCRRRLSRLAERDVGGHREEEHEPLGAALARDVADAAIDRVGRRGEAHLAAAHDEPSARMRREAGERARQLLAAGADHAGDAEDLALMQLEARRR